MDYNLKVIINGVEVLENTGTEIVDGVEYITPSITNVTLENSASLGAMDIGATASDKLTFTMLNPYKRSFDGETVEFWIAENGDGAESTLAIIEEAVGSDTASASIDITENRSNLIEDEEEGEDLTAEELLDVDDTEAVNDEDLFNQLEGEADDTAPDETIETGWMQMGVYYVMGQDNNEDGSITITAYDGFCKMNGFYNPVNASGTVQSLFDDLRTATLNDCGIVIDEYEFDDVQNINTALNVLTTYRGALGYFAGLVGGFAEFDSDGSVGISFYSFTGNELIRSELLSYAEDSAGEMVLQELTCNTAVNGTEEITVGAGQGVSFANPLMTEAILEDVLATYNGMRFVGGTFAALWNPSLMAGRFVRIFTEEEYANYLELSNEIENETDPDALLELKGNINTLGSIMLICSQVIDFRGDATMRAISGNTTEASKNNAMTPPMIQKVIEAGKTATNYLWQDSDGALRVSRDIDNYSVRIDADSLDILDGDTVRASFGETTTFYGDESTLELTANGEVIRGYDGNIFFSMEKNRSGVDSTTMRTTSPIGANIPPTGSNAMRVEGSKRFTDIRSITFKCITIDGLTEFEHTIVGGEGITSLEDSYVKISNVFPSTVFVLGVTNKGATYQGKQFDILSVATIEGYREQSSGGIIDGDLDMSGNLTINANRVSDYVTQDGNASNLYYRRYANGTCEIWGTHTSNVACNTVYSGSPSNNAYHTANISVNLPFAIDNASVNLTGQGIYVSGVYYVGTINNGNTIQYVIWLPITDSARSRTVDIHIFATIKN